MDQDSWHKNPGKTAKFGVLITRETETMAAKPQIVISESQIIRVSMIYLVIIDRLDLQFEFIHFITEFHLSRLFGRILRSIFCSWKVDEKAVDRG